MNREEWRESKLDKKVERWKEITEIIKNILIILTSLVALIKVLFGWD
ncbi:hypothetical protein [Macrococcoides caseolyticum]|nr:hypothetical protein [Macrococcus caseolyticus]